MKLFFLQDTYYLFPVLVEIASFNKKLQECIPVLKISIYFLVFLTISDLFLLKPVKTCSIGTEIHIILFPILVKFASFSQKLQECIPIYFIAFLTTSDLFCSTLTELLLHTYRNANKFYIP